MRSGRSRARSASSTAWCIDRSPHRLPPRRPPSAPADDETAPSRRPRGALPTPPALASSGITSRFPARHNTVDRRRLGSAATNNIRLGVHRQRLQFIRLALLAPPDSDSAPQSEARRQPGADSPRGAPTTSGFPLVSSMSCPATRSSIGPRPLRGARALPASGPSTTLLQARETPPPARRCEQHHHALRATSGADERQRHRRSPIHHCASSITHTTGRSSCLRHKPTQPAT